MKRQAVRLAIMVLVLASLAIAQDTPANPVKAEGYSYAATIAAQRVDPETHTTHLNLAVENKRTRQVATMDVETVLERVDAMHVYDNKVVLIGGSEDTRFRGVLILDAAELKKIDYISTWQSWISPGGRYLVFQQWYPRLAPAAQKSDVLLVYDLSETPQANRAVPAVRPTRPFTGERTGVLDAAYSTQVGFPVFPEENAGRSYQANIPDAEQQHSIVVPTGGLDRLETDGTLVAADWSNGKNWLVEINVKPGLSNPKLRKTALQLESANAQRSGFVAVTEVERNGDGSYSVTLSPASGRPQRTRALLPSTE